MNDIIRKGVELAPGWEAHGTANSFYCKGFGWYCPDDGFDEYGKDRWFLDALAAELVRQVDALNNAYMSFFADETRCNYEKEDGTQITFRSKGKQRTTNTLRAIVESGVLEPQDSR